MSCIDFCFVQFSQINKLHYKDEQKTIIDLKEENID